MIERRATVVWEGDLMNGAGRVTTRNSEVRDGTPPEQLEVDATCWLDRGEEGLRIASMHLAVAGRGPRRRVAGESRTDAEERCPISGALRGNVDITVDASVLTDARVPADASTDPTREP